MKLIFEKSVPGRGCGLLPVCDVEAVSLPAGLEREVPPALPEMSETDVSRHYILLPTCSQRTEILYGSPVSSASRTGASSLSCHWWTALWRSEPRRARW